MGIKLILQSMIERSQMFGKPLFKILELLTSCSNALEKIN